VLARHLHLEAIPDDPSRWGVEVRSKDRLAAALREGREQAMLFRQLAMLRTDVPLAETLGDLEWRGARRPELTALCHAIGAPELLERVRRWRAD
jgi:5'-3' exonuclease